MLWLGCSCFASHGHFLHPVPSLIAALLLSCCPQLATETEGKEQVEAENARLLKQLEALIGELSRGEARVLSTRQECDAQLAAVKELHAKHELDSRAAMAKLTDEYSAVVVGLAKAQGELKDATSTLQSREAALSELQVEFDALKSRLQAEECVLCCWPRVVVPNAPV